MAVSESAVLTSPNGTDEMVARNGSGSEGRDVYDITIIGAGPTAISPEKYIYDVIGFPKVLAKDFVEACHEQALRSEPTIRLKEEVLTLERLPDGVLRLGT